MKPYEEAIQSIRGLRPIRVYVGRDLELAWRDGNKLKPDLSERIESLRDNIYRRFGVEMPAVRFIPDYSLRDGGSAFRIEMVGQTTSDTGVQTTLTKSDTAIDKLMNALTPRAELMRTHWVDPEDLYSWPKAIDAPLQAWLDQHYSLTDVKLLLRAVVNPSADEEKQRTNKRPIEVRPEKTLRHLNWLLGSLTFWSHLNDPLAAQQMASDLQRTEYAHVVPVSVRNENSRAAKYVYEGIKALSERHIPAAETLFSQAIHTDREGAINSFLGAYSQSLSADLLHEVDRDCQQSSKSSLNRANRVDFQDLLESFGQKANQEQARKLASCLLKDWPDNRDHELKAFELQSMKRYGTPDEWSPEDAKFLAQKALKDYNPVTDGPAVIDEAEAFLISAMHRDPKNSLTMFRDVLTLTQGSKHSYSYSKLLLDLAKIPDADPSITLEMAYQLSQKERRQDLELALELADRVVNTIPATLSIAKRTILLDWVHYSQAEALKGLSSLGVADHWIEAEKLYTSLQNSKEVGFNSHVALAQLKVEQALYQEADKILSDTAKNKQWQVKAELHSKRLVLNLETFNRDGVAETAQEALKKASEESDKNERVGLLFTAALGKLLTRGEDWEQTARKFITETDHDYVPYIAMMLYARLAGQEQDEAKGVLEERWSKADPSHWEERLRAGEETAWREMLIGYCLGHVKRDEIFGPLESNDAFSKSALQSVPLGRSGMLCEAYFYGALLAQAQGNKTEMEKDLRQVLATNRRSYYEYAMAKFLLWQESNSSKQAKATLARSVFGAP